jgi:hypothetical protein
LLLTGGIRPPKSLVSADLSLSLRALYKSS